MQYLIFGNERLMGLRTKLNLLLLVVGSLGAVLFGIVSNRYLNILAENEVERNAWIMMASAAGVRAYTSDEVAPLLEERTDTQFHLQAVSAYAAVKNFAVLHGQLPDYSYREPALNPTNPIDRATDWEADIIQDFRAHPSKLMDKTIRATAKGDMMHLSKPIIAEKPCLVCHGTPKAAPAPMLAIYGPDHGFGWKAKEIIGAQIVSAPMQVAYDHAKQTRLLFLEIYFLVLIVLGTLLNVGLGLIVTGPVRRMSHIAEEVSLGRSDAPQFHGRGSDEIARLGQSFTRMRRSSTPWVWRST